MVVELSKSFHFDAAHWLPTFPEGHKCRRMHGHSFRVEVFLSGEVPPEQGYLIDYGEVGAAMKPIIDRLDHYVLNEIDGLDNPTAENLAIWIWNRLKPLLPLVSAIRVLETCTTACEYRGE
jgi:6-pyruvoyltetrahydropterin/6-carboxytetrahydropterin synthase